MQTRSVPMMKKTPMSSSALSTALSLVGDDSEYTFATWGAHLRDHLLLEYAYILSVQPTMWQLAVK